MPGIIEGLRKAGGVLCDTTCVGVGRANDNNLALNSGSLSHDDYRKGFESPGVLFAGLSRLR